MVPEWVPLPSGFGVEIRGLSPADMLAGREQVFRDAFAQHHMVLLRNCKLDEDQQVRLTELLGDVSHASPNMKDGKKFSYVSNVLPEGTLRDGELLFHSDFMFMPRPLTAIALYAIEVPKKGGETLFADAGLALQRLPGDLRRRIDSLQARHIANYKAFDGGGRPKYDPNARKQFVHVHPLVWTHPESGQEVLFASRLLTESVMDLPAEEGEALLQELFGYIEDSAHQYAHAWRPGDYLVWDNRWLQHARRDFDPGERRSMRRVPIE